MATRPGRRRAPGAKPYRNYSKDTLIAALAAINTGMPLREAELKFKIPRATLSRKRRGVQLKKVGRPQVFNEDLEEVFVQSIATAAAWGYPLTGLDLSLIVKSYLDRVGLTEQRFKNNVPGRYWLEGFLQRHKNVLSLRLSENIKRQRAGVTHDTLKSYFQELKITLEGVGPAAIINFDETNMSDDPGRQKVLVRRGAKHAHKILDTSKSSTSVMFAGTASGFMLAPYVVYKAEHLYSTWVEGGPPNTVYNRSRSGWFDTTIFEDWFLKVIIPYAQSIGGGPVVVIGDNLSSHFSIDVIKKCADCNIKFVCLPANSTGLCQPLDVAVFRPLKIKWRAVLLSWKEKNKGTLPKHVFPRLLKQTLDNLENKEKNLQSGFEAAGIYPVNEKRVLDKLPKEIDPEMHDNATKQWLESFQNFLGEMRSKECSTAPKKKKVAVVPGKGVTEKDLLAQTNEKAKTANTKATTKRTSKSKKKVCRLRSSESSTSCSDYEDWRQEILNNADSSLDDIFFSGNEYTETVTFANIDDTSQSGENIVPHPDFVDPIFTADPLDNANEELNTSLSRDAGAGCSKDVDSETIDKSLEILQSCFVIVELIYDENSKKPTKKKFIAQVKNIVDNNVTCRFMRCFSEMKRIYVFPAVDDVMTIDTAQIVEKINPVQVKRGKYIFNIEL